MKLTEYLKDIGIDKPIRNIYGNLTSIDNDNLQTIEMSKLVYVKYLKITNKNRVVNPISLQSH